MRGRGRLLVPIIVGLIVLAAISAFWMPHHAATNDERAVMVKFMPMLQNPDCAPVWTSVISQRPRNRQWVEAPDGERAQIEAASQRARSRNVQLLAQGSWPLPFLISKIGECEHPIRVSAPSIDGNLAFVTAASANGVETLAFERGPDGWQFRSMVWDGKPISQY